MANFFDYVPAGPLLDEAGIEWRGQNFEDIYSLINDQPELSELRKRLEGVVFEYFASLRLPETVTIYDKLLLSLREKDVIATFNWDPLLVQAYKRNIGKVASLPRIMFLHGNVAIGYCKQDSILSIAGTRCPKCGNILTQSKLLYPVASKDYQSEPMIRSAWKQIRSLMKACLCVTIFGYGAPASDAAAVDLLATAWGTPSKREFEQIEIIDIREVPELRSNWDRFIHTHHYQVERCFADSWIANHPRRTVEAFINQFIEAKLIESNPLPDTEELSELWEWFAPLTAAEAETLPA